MPNKSLEKNVSKKLFLICPTDNIEHPIRNNFSGEAFYLTALGVYFEFDFEVQLNLWGLIRENGIDEIIFVSAIDNVFYNHAFEKNIMHDYPVDRALAKVKNKISKHLMQPEVFSSNFYLLIERHLTNQKKRLLSTPYLGSHLKRQKIGVNAYVYQAPEKFFTPSGKLRREDIY